MKARSFSMPAAPPWPALIMSTITANLQAVRQRIESRGARGGTRARSVALVAVSKTFRREAVRAAAAAGQRDFGENYVQEGVGKIARAAHARTSCGTSSARSRATRRALIAEHFDWVHSLEREKIAERLSPQARGTQTDAAGVHPGQRLGRSEQERRGAGGARAAGAAGRGAAAAQAARPDGDPRADARRAPAAAALRAAARAARPS